MSKLLLQFLHTGQQNKHIFLSFHSWLGMQTVVATSAIFFVVCFSEIKQQMATTAQIGLCIGHHLSKQLLRNLLLCHRFALDQFFQPVQILIIIKGDTGCLPVITSYPAGFLIMHPTIAKEVVEQLKEEELKEKVKLTTNPKKIPIEEVEKPSTLKDIKNMTADENGNVISEEADPASLPTSP